MDRTVLFRRVLQRAPFIEEIDLSQPMKPQMFSSSGATLFLRKHTAVLGLRQLSPDHRHLKQISATYLFE